jgi:precorrin-2 dehydrogenase/sirohydrochlorin ferrochelatase
MGKIRKALLSQAHAPEAHKTLFEQLIDAGILDMLREQQIAAVDNLLQDVLGERFTYSRLMSPEGFTHN